MEYLKLRVYTRKEHFGFAIPLCTYLDIINLNKVINLSCHYVNCLSLFLTHSLTLSVSLSQSLSVCLSLFLPMHFLRMYLSVMIV